MTKENIRKTTIKTADKLAQQDGFENAQDFISRTGARMRSADPVERTGGERVAGDFTAKLALLTLYQTIDGEYNLEPYNWINKFETVKIEAGNSKMFIRDILTGVDDYNVNNFIPQSATNPQVDSHTISLYSANTTSSADKQLQPWARKILKPLTINRNDWVPYFISGKLQEFINKISENIRKSLHLAKFKIFQDLVTKLKTGTNTAGNNEGMWNIINNPSGVNNLLDVFTKVIFPKINEMRFLNTAYNVGNVKPSGNSTANNTLNSSDPSDILILVNNKTYTKLTTGVLAQVFNNKLLEIEHWLPKENIIPVGPKLSVGASTTAISVENADLIGENEVVVINKNVIKGLLFVDQHESQAWAQNMTLQLVAHIWLAYGIIPWGQGFTVRTNALTTMPSNPQGN